MATRTIANGGGDYNTAATFAETAVPTTADDVVATATSGNVSIANSAAGLCKSFDFTNYVGQLTLGTNSAIQVASSSVAAGNCKFVSTMTIVLGNASAGLDLRGNDAATHQLTMVGRTIGVLSVFAASSSTVWQLQDALTCTGAINLNRGTLDFNGQTVNALSLNPSANSLSRALTFGAANVTLTGSSGSIYNAATTTNLTVSAASSVMTLSGNNVTFAGGGFTYGTVNLTGTGTATVTGANTVGTLTRTNAAAVTLTLPASTTTTVSTTLTLSKGSSLASSSAGTQATISSPAALSVERVSIKDIARTGAGSLVAVNCRDQGNNSGVTFTPQQRGFGMEL